MGWAVDENVAYGKAVIEVQKHEPTGVFEKTWYSVDSQCHGCWHSCGSGSPLRKAEDIDVCLERKKKRILNCKEWKGRPRIMVKDFRKVQTSLF